MGASNAGIDVLACRRVLLIVLFGPRSEPSTETR
jgi:hypothetical protein